MWPRRPLSRPTVRCRNSVATALFIPGCIEAEPAEQMDMGTPLKEGDTPERMALQREIAQTIQKALDDLPDDLRTAITLRELDGLTYEEIAQAMDCPIGTVRSRIFRAREAIDAKLKPLLAP